MLKTKPQPVILRHAQMGEVFDRSGPAAGVLCIWQGVMGTFAPCRAGGFRLGANTGWRGSVADSFLSNA